MQSPSSGREHDGSGSGLGTCGSGALCPVQVCGVKEIILYRESSTGQLKWLRVGPGKGGVEKVNLMLVGK